MLIQLPVFFALYLTLKHYSKHIHGSWLHVVPNISDKPTVHWSGYVLVAIYIGSQVASTFFMGAQMDKMQRNIFLLLPLIMITVVLRFPIGLLMYWMTTNLWTVGQGLVTRKLVPRTPAPSLGSFGKRATPATANGAVSKTPAKSAPAKAAAVPATPAPKPANAAQQPRRVRRKKGGPRR
jgi:YidC/Oxa1 family membrane protein insertase